MTMKQVAELKAEEMKKLEALEQIVKILESLKNEDAVEWVIEKLSE